jgi:hypothetical protein
MKKVAIIGANHIGCTNIEGFIHPIKERGITIVNNERIIDDSTTEVFYFEPCPVIEIPQYFVPNIKGHQRPYKFHR